MKKRMIAIIGSIIVVICAVILLLNTGLQIRVRKDSITKAAVMNGNNGAITVVEGEKLSELLDSLLAAKGEKIKNVETTGWQYSLFLYENDNLAEKIEMISEKTWVIRGQRYGIDNGSKVMEMLNTFSV